MTDMTRHLKRWLTTTALSGMGGEFDGVIAAVTEEPIRNKYTGLTSTEPVIMFEEGGYRWIPNKSALQKLIGWFGAESTDWNGRRVRIYLVPVESKNGRKRWHRAIACEDAHARFQTRGQWPASVAAAANHQREPGEDDMVTADEIFGDRRRAL
jgi:hypothetical protein